VENHGSGKSSVLEKSSTLSVLARVYVWGATESPLKIVAQRCALEASLRGEATERSPKPSAFTVRRSLYATAVNDGMSLSEAFQDVHAGQIPR